MFAARSFSRLAIRATPVCRIAGRSMATKSPRLASSQTAVSFFKQPASILRFSTTAFRRNDEGTVDPELVAKLESEIALEKELKVDDTMPEAVRSFLEEGQFKIVDKPGNEEVELVRQFGNETIRVEFSISDLNLMQQQDEMDEDALYEDESSDDIPENTQSGGAQSQIAKEKGRVQVANEAEEDDEFLDEESPEPSFPAHLNIVIEKPTGAIKIAALAQDGMIILQNIVHHKNTDLLKTKSAENDYQSEGLYAGPEFANLDDELQVLFERYLDERGINTALALFVPEYIEYKEEKEYTRWLESLKDFVAA